VRVTAKDFLFFHQEGDADSWKYGSLYSIVAIRGIWVSVSNGLFDHISFISYGGKTR